MKERPILFSGPMVRALLDGTKTQTRRVFKTKNGGLWPNKNDLPGLNQILRGCPYGQPGDRLWVREKWAAPHRYDHLGPSNIPVLGVSVHYAASEDLGGLLWRPSIHMPRWASRITLEITGVRVERLQDISRADSIAEGVQNQVRLTGYSKDGGCRWEEADPIEEYRALWESINGPGSWDADPWVWVVEFKRMKGNEA